MKDIIEHNKKLKADHSEEFSHTFGTSLFRFMHPLFGFDVIAFDKWLETPDGTSTSDYLKVKYSGRAEELIAQLIS